jgi:hypothetical protein
MLEIMSRDISFLSSLDFGECVSGASRVNLGASHETHMFVDTWGLNICVEAFCIEVEGII